MTSLADLTATTPGLPCRTTDPELWFSKSSTDRATAIALCQECPIRQACAQYALDDRSLMGIWGGTTAADRRSFRDGQPWRFDEEGRLRLECGSERAYRAHFAYREAPCALCVAAHEALITGERRARLVEEHVAGGSAKGFWIHRRLGEPPCLACVGALRAQQEVSRLARTRRGRTGARGGSVASGTAEALPGPQAAVQRLALAG